MLLVCCNIIGVLILGSGASFHNFEYFFARDEKKRLEGIEHSRIWNQYLEEVLCGSAGAEDRKKRMMQWEHAPSARAAHPPRQVCNRNCISLTGNLGYDVLTVPTTAIV